MDDGLLCLSSNKAIVDMDTMHKMHGDVMDLYVYDPLLVPQKHSTQEGSSLTKEGNGQHDEESEREWENGDDSDFSGFQESSEDDEEEEELNHVVITEPPIEIMNEEGEHSDKSDDLQCMDNEEGEDLGDHKRKYKFKEFDGARDMTNPTLLEGMIFPNVTTFRTFLKEYHIREGYEFEYVKNESTRVIVICKDKCGFRLHASPMHGEKSFQIKTIIAQHACIRKYINKWATHKWLANKYKDTLAGEPDKKVKTLKNDVKREWMLDVSRKKAWRTKRTALQLIHGNHKEQYLLLWGYCEVLRKLRDFLLDADLSLGWMLVFLKGPYAGQLMHATGRDGNDQMYPLCMAVVEAELKDSWVWFLENLMTVVERPEQMGWCSMSDRQKGLIEAFKKLMPGVEHRFCLRHMYANFSKTYRGKEFKDLFWRATSAYTRPEFEENMEILKSVSKDAHEWMVREVPEVWARSFDSPRSKVNRMDNNMSEGFNNWIQEAREMPVLTMIETIRRQLRQKYVKRLEFSEKFNGILCPHIAKKLGYKIENACGMEVFYSDPPPLKAKAGRPKKCRRKGEDEEQNPFKKAKYSGETSGGTSVTQGRGGGTTGRGGGRGARGCGRSGTSARGGGTSGRSGTSARGGTRGKANAVDLPHPERASKRFKQVGEAWISSQQSTTTKAYGPLSKLHPTGPLMRNGIAVSTKSFVSSQASTEPG
ncbi:hypothetical protein Vadar_020923 [Vaccinium darrowii]|uniref:Uncharacterized protein n=1 Tax=Vaccinium darrowii TaxID=229202 RepID=A0ACB7ZKF5_9ERIC|nr:hypothetical protein Vadar_020923 [Vaccinium darrowii]